MKNKLPVFDCQFSNEMESASFVCLSTGNRRSQIKNYAAFTLVELLVVISIIGVLAALLFPAFSAVKKHALINRADAEMAQLETAIDNYKAAYGFYPPGSSATINNIPISQLYYELEGTTFNSTNNSYTTLDDSAQIASGDVSAAFGASVGGFMNCTRPGAGEDSPKARNFLPDLRPNQIGTVTNPPASSTVVNVLITSVGGPDQGYQPLSAPSLNPWRYVYPGTNNPNSYDLWVQLSIGSSFNPATHAFIKTNTYLICNWSKQVQINSPLP
jgi:prepilin-type N-terminal cleavage/methylation domain-containing protein